MRKKHSMEILAGIILIFFLIEISLMLIFRALIGSSLPPDYIESLSFSPLAVIGFLKAFELAVLVFFFSSYARSRKNSMQSELRHLKNDLSETEIRYRSLVSNVPGVTFRCSAKNWIMTFISSELETLSGYTPEMFIGDDAKPFETIIHPDDRQKLRHVINESIDRGENFNAEYRIIHRDGSVKWVYEKGLGITDNEGKLLYLDGVIIDVSDIRFLRTYLQSIVNSMPSVIMGIGIDGRISFWNSKTERLTGLSSPEALGCPFCDVFPTLTPLADRILEAVHKREEVHIPRKLKRDNGEDSYEEITVFPIATDEIEGAVIRIDDVTEKYKLEEAIVQKDKMLSVGGLAAGMAHELNNPLAGLIQTVNVMARRLDFSGNVLSNDRSALEAGIDPQEMKKYLENRDFSNMIKKINESGMRMSLIINDMLGFARKSDNIKKSNDLSKIIDLCLKFAATDFDINEGFDFRNIDIVREIEDGLPLIHCDEVKIQQVILNLLRNGSQALQKSQTISPKITIRLHNDTIKDFVQLEIEDNGPGMEEDVRKRVFEPFFTTKPERIGMGLGLSVSYFIIKENHNGEMYVESRPGFGSRFVIRLPYA